jgi:hypothetical protein
MKLPSENPRPLRRRVLARGSVLLLAIAGAIGVSACGSAATSTSPGASPTPTPAPTADPSAIGHATGATDVVFRFEEGGGFVPMDFFTTQAPQFTLYGDGTVIFRDSTQTGQQNPNPNIVAQVPFQTVRFDEAAMQAFLKFALADSGLGVARSSYRPGNVADMPTAVFTINAGGVSKTVSVEALGSDDAQSPDAPILKALAALGERVRAFGPAVEGETTWIPTRWRGVLVEDQAGAHAVWPWKDIAPAGFVVQAGDDAPQFPIRTMTPAEVDVLGLTDIDGGFSGLGLAGPDGKAYRFSLRPLLPDESL